MSNTIKYKDDSIYVGDVFKDGKYKRRHGKGMYTFKSGDKYEGEYDMDKQHGWGIYSFTRQGQRYLGQWAKGQMHGNGIMYFDATLETFYVGDFANGERNGKGYYQYDLHNCRAVTYEDGKMINDNPMTPDDVKAKDALLKSIQDSICEVAPLLYADTVPKDVELKFEKIDYGKSSYEGTVRGTKRHGKGLYIFPTGDKYEGEYKDNQHDGWGVYLFTAGARYIGQWKNNLVHGEGVYYYDGETFYVGAFENDKRHGEGYYQYEDGTLAKVRFNRGEKAEETAATEDDKVACEKKIEEIVAAVRPFAPNLLPEGTSAAPPKPDENEEVHVVTKTIKYDDGSVYEGEVNEKNDMRHGCGHYTFAEGDVYEGQYKNGKFNGYGTYVFASEDPSEAQRYVGAWLNGAKSGLGLYLYGADGKNWFFGDWKEDKKFGVGYQRQGDLIAKINIETKKHELVKDKTELQTMATELVAKVKEYAPKQLSGLPDIF